VTTRSVVVVTDSPPPHALSSPMAAKAVIILNQIPTLFVMALAPEFAVGARYGRVVVVVVLRSVITGADGVTVVTLSRDTPPGTLVVDCSRRTCDPSGFVVVCVRVSLRLPGAGATITGGTTWGTTTTGGFTVVAGRG
jgi:hypothetical protein